MGSSVLGANGTAESGHGADTGGLAQVTDALNVIYDPRSTNQARQDATSHLESLKSLPDAAARGFALASDQTALAVARHYGLSLLGDTIQYRCDQLGNYEKQALKGWIIRLAGSVDDAEPVFLRNKIAQLWFEFAKRCWLDEWIDMDELLVQLWERSFAQQTIVLSVLESLSDECFSKDNNSSLTNSADMGKACVEIFVPSQVLAQVHPDRNIQGKYRCGSEGWLRRLLVRLQWCLDRFSGGSQQVKSCLLQTLQTFRSAMTWCVLRAVSEMRCIEVLCRILQLEDVQAQTAALDVLHALYHRTHYLDEEVKSLVCPMLSSEGLTLLRRLYDTSAVAVENIDEQKYLLLKKLAEVVCALGIFIEQRSQLMANECDISAAFDFFIHALRNDSLVVSIPVLYLWTKLLACKGHVVPQKVTPLVGVLLEISSHRLLRYETLPTDSNNATFRFLDEDFDTMPERHAFVGNFRRFCTEIVERVVRQSPFEAMRHVLGQADELFESIDAQTPQTQEGDEYTSNSFTVLSVDAQSTVVTSAAKGYLSWLTAEQAKMRDHEADHQTLQREIGQWCSTLLKRDFSDPAVQKRALQLCSELTSHILRPDTSVPLAIAERVLSKRTSGRNDLTPFGEALRDLYTSRSRILQKLAMKFPDKFMSVYDELRASIERVAAEANTEHRMKMELSAVPFIVVHRTHLFSRAQKLGRLNEMVEPVLAAWQDPQIAQSAASFDFFCVMLGVDRIPQYFLSRHAQSLTHWSSQPLNEEGLIMRDSISDRSENLPLQPLKSLLMASTDRIRHGAEDYTIAAELWEPSIPIVLPKVLQFITHAHAFGNPRKWSSFPDEMQIIIQRTLVDRVWQSGISSETRDDFYVRVRDSKTTLEGLASSTRAAVRGVRELSYWVLHCMCQFGESFYSHSDLAEPLAKALYEDADALSSHQVSTLLRISMALIDACPVHHRSAFLPPLISHLYRQVDRKLTTEWQLIGTKEQDPANDETLDAEMKTESVLRQLTFSAATLASTLISLQSEPYTGPPMRGLTLSSSPILSSLVIFSNHVLRMRDTRSCSLITRILRSIIPEFADANQTHQRKRSEVSISTVATSDIDPTTVQEIREFFCSDVLKGAITSLHEQYFAELQKDLGALIASILFHYNRISSTPRSVLQSLPGMTDQHVDRALDQINANQSERHQRACVLNLLEGLRGVSIHEMGKIAGAASHKERVGGKMRSAMQEQFANMAVDGQTSTIERGGSVEVEGVGQLFD